MLAATDIADWWDEQHRTSQKALDELIDTYPNWFGVVVATSAATAMQLGAGLVDVLRLGEGAAEGGLGGIAKDGLRLLQLAPAAGKASRFVLARVVVDRSGGVCTWMSASKALRHVGAKMFASVEDLARAAGKSTSALGPAWVSEVVPLMRQLGARVTELNKGATLDSIGAAVTGAKVALFSVKWLKNGKTVGHTLYAFRNSVGQLLFADRTGTVVKTLSELESMYRGIGSATVYGSSALVEGPRILFASGLAVLSMEVRAQLAANPETVAQTLEIKKQLHLAPPPPTARYHTVVANDWLSKLAKRYYGDMLKWPLIYEANRQTIGSNPDLIRVGQKLLIPEAPRVTAVRN